jgi:antitoxin component of MazEF toxin-antitoxin module
MKIKIYEISGTTVVRLPRDYVKDHEIRKTGYVHVRENEDGDLIISPEVR